MLLRRMTEHVKAQNWTAVGLDFLIVVIGVFIGIQVANWNDARADKKTGREYVARIQQELLANQHDMNTRIAYFTKVKNSGLDALKAWGQPPDTLGEQFIIDSYYATFALRRAIGKDTYNELLSVGAINSIPDLVVRQRIAEYYRASDGAEFFLKTIPRYIDSLRTAMPYDVQAALRERGCVGTYYADDTGAPTAILPETCHPNLTDEQISLTISRLIEADLEQDLGRAVADIDVKLMLFHTVIGRSQNLYDFLEEAK